MNSILSAPRLALTMMMTAGALIASSSAYADKDSQPTTITIKTSAYEVSGEYNLFTLCLDTYDVIYLDVDCGFGSVEYEIEPSEDGTWIPCTVTPAGVVTMTTDHPELIYYMYCQGGHITDIDLSNLTGLQMLDLSKNRLQRIDLTQNTQLTYISLGENPFDVESLNIPPMPDLVVLEVEGVDNLYPEYDLKNYPNLLSFSAFSSKNLTKVDPSGSPNLQHLSIDVTNVSSLDVSKNPELRILNVSNTPISSIDLSQNSKLEELYVDHFGSFAEVYKFESLDITHNPNLRYLFAQGNALTDIDISKNTLLQDIYIHNNYLTSFDYSNNENLVNVNISQNNLDFATLPIEPYFGGEYYYQQRPIPVALSFPENSVLDLSGKVLREGTETTMELYARPLTDPFHPIKLSQDLYGYEDGKITFHKEYKDSVYAAFSNPYFPDCVLTTTNFMIKNEDAYDKPSISVSVTPAIEIEQSLSLGIGVSEASTSNPQTIYVDCGDGVMTPVTVTSQVPEDANVTIKRLGYSDIRIYVNDGYPLTALIIDDQKLYNIDLYYAPELRVLELNNTDLVRIDLSRQRCLQKIKLTGNSFGYLTLKTEIVGYDKNALIDIDLSNNQLTELDYGVSRAVKYLNVSQNNLSYIDIDHAYALISLDISHNNFTELNTDNLDSLESLNVADNYFTEVVKPWQNTLKNLDCRDNNLIFGTLPYLTGELEGNYLYAPQRKVIISSKGPSANLSAIASEVNGHPTEYVWRDESGSVLTEGKDYEMSDGFVRFINYNAGDVYCDMTNAEYPDFSGENALRTSVITVAAPPTNEIGWFDVAQGPAEGQELILIGDCEDTSVCIDWSGDGKDYINYALTDTYRSFNIVPIAGKRAKVYTYEDEANLAGFSITGVALKGADFSKMTKLISLSITEGGTPDIIFPESDILEELVLVDNGLKILDPSRLGNLRLLNLAGNNLTSFDLSPYRNLEVAILPYNGMKELKLDNPLLWDLDLTGNEFENFSFENLPSLHQAYLAHNHLSSIDIDGPELLRVLRIDYNNFTFQTLPVPTETLTIYGYGNQAPISVNCEGMKVDLSWLYDVHGYFSEFYWCEGEPFFDEEDYSLSGYFLQPGIDYTLDEGVTTFLHEVANVCGVILSPLFPKTYMLTELMNIKDSNVETIVASTVSISVNGRTLTISSAEGKEYGVYGVDGRVIATGIAGADAINVELPAAGIYIVKAGKASMKVAVK